MVRLGIRSDGIPWNVLTHIAIWQGSATLDPYLVNLSLLLNSSIRVAFHFCITILYRSQLLWVHWNVILVAWWRLFRAHLQLKPINIDMPNYFYWSFLFRYLRVAWIIGIFDHGGHALDKYRTFSILICLILFRKCFIRGFVLFINIGWLPSMIGSSFSSLWPIDIFLVDATIVSYCSILFFHFFVWLSWSIIIVSMVSLYFIIFFNIIFLT